MPPEPIRENSLRNVIPGLLVVLHGREGAVLGAVLGIFLLIYFAPLEQIDMDNAFMEGLRLTRWYAREHVILCLLPAFVIAGALATFVSQGAVMRRLGPDASKPVAYAVGAVSGTLLAVCSCTVLPLFGGIYRRGAGLGPAIAFLYAGPAINIMAIIVTAKILGAELGLARAVGAIVFSVVIGVLMQLIYRREESRRGRVDQGVFADSETGNSAGDVIALFALMIGILVFANWAAADNATWMRIHAWKWPITGILAVLLALLLVRRWHWRRTGVIALAGVIAVCVLLFPGIPDLAMALGIGGLMLLASLPGNSSGDWTLHTWDFSKQILPLLLGGVFLAGVLLGRPGHEGLVPEYWVVWALGDNSFGSTLMGSVLGAFMYFSTLTEVPIVEGLLGSGMGKGPALAILLAGPALSLPNMLVIRSIIGTGKTLVYCGLVVVMATLSGYVYGQL